MKAPEKIYIHPDIGGREFTKSWSKRIVSQESVEYTRTDAFIEKACAFIRERLIFDDNAWYTDGEVTLKDEVIEEFKNYMKS